MSSYHSLYRRQSVTVSLDGSTSLSAELPAIVDGFIHMVRIVPDGGNAGSADFVIQEKGTTFPKNSILSVTGVNSESTYYPLQAAHDSSGSTTGTYITQFTNDYITVDLTNGTDGDSYTIVIGWVEANRLI